MKNVQYTVQGRYRLMARRLFIEVIVSTLNNNEISLKVPISFVLKA